jgi:putative Mn2+ efflux pump MntP
MKMAVRASLYICGSQVVGGLILIGISVKILAEHLLV